ncbi:MAG: hypothetical protein IT349_02125 [Candidatus Eisenbacteria bacterium]|nr:hypothetical protein [Candidatus Eisenbacteria bacterium]
MESVPGTPVTTSLSPHAIQSLAEELHRAIQRDLTDAGLVPIKKLEMAARWSGGELIMKPAKDGLQEKAVPIDQFFRKIVLIREQLRNLEREINNHAKLDDDDRIELQQYVTRIYGSLTTFNVLFAEKNDQFVGQSSRR